MAAPAFMAAIVSPASSASRLCRARAAEPASRRIHQLCMISHIITQPSEATAAGPSRSMVGKLGWAGGVQGHFATSAAAGLGADMAAPASAKAKTADAIVFTDVVRM